MSTNYARNRQTKQTVFFSGPLPDSFNIFELPQWAFYRLPPNYHLGNFLGRIIGEDPQPRCVRLNHSPRDKQCEVCNRARVEGK
jgi:hypothetical protein